jgi:hypothetical protein
MNSEEELILGFDIRVENQSLQDHWSSERRNHFLLRTDVLEPYSVDTNVWPSIINDDVRPGTCIGYQDLWCDLTCLISVASLRSEKAINGRLISVSLVSTESSHISSTWRSKVPPTVPPTRADDWEFIGYDVADEWLLSGLSNCGFLPIVDDVPALRVEWSPRLNEHHLFSTIEHAKMFEQFANSRITEHAPFFVYAIWRIPAGNR